MNMSRLLGFLTLGCGGAAINRAVVGLLTHERVRETIASSDKVEDRHVELVSTLSWWLNVGWLAFAGLSLITAILLLGTSMGGYLLLWSTAALGFPLTLAAFGLPSPTTVWMASLLAIATTASALVVNMTAKPEPRRNRPRRPQRFPA